MSAVEVDFPSEGNAEQNMKTLGTLPRDGECPEITAAWVTLVGLVAPGTAAPATSRSAMAWTNWIAERTRR